MIPIPEFPCRDCGVNTCPLEPPREYYEVNDFLWQHDAKATGIGQADHGPNGYFLCIGCLEKRIGRELTPQDFKPYPANKPSRWLSKRLNDRLGIDEVHQQALAPCKIAPQFYPGALWPAVMKRYKPPVFGVGTTGAYAEGGRCEWPEDQKG